MIVVTGNLSNIKMKSLPVRLVSVVPCLLSVAPYEESAFVLFGAPL